MFVIYFEDTNKRVRNMKFTSIFFKASAVYFRGFPQRYTKNIKKVLFPVICCQASLKRKRNVPFSKEWLIIRNVPISLVLPTCAPMHAHVS